MLKGNGKLVLLSGNPSLRDPSKVKESVCRCIGMLKGNGKLVLLSGNPSYTGPQ